MVHPFKISGRSLMILSFAGWLLSGCSFFHSAKPDAVIEIDLNKPGKELSRDMYGVFFEDINHAADGGLYGELINNRDFEANRTPEQMKWINDSTVVNDKGWTEIYRKPDPLFRWSSVVQGDAEAKISLESVHPLNASNPQSLKLDVTKVNNGRAGVANDGYWGISIKKNCSYLLNFYCRKGSAASGSVKVSLEGKNGKVYAWQIVEGIGPEWKSFKAKLTANADDPAARFVISTSQPGTYWFDVVSLFPENTWKQRPNGMREDLAKMLAALKPSFLRFPGGCVVEGATLNNRFQWKKTIGEVAQRPGHWNLWGYHSTDGLGFHEYLQLCEDLKAAPIYVVNVGMSCQARFATVAPSEKINDYLQETLDALEYAMGPVNSKWGAVRAANGHPAPFQIKYVEIGNENSGPDYQLAYKMMQPVIKKKYPKITTIADEAIHLTPEDLKKYPGVSVEMVDEHYYNTPGFFFDQTKRYDAYSRKDPWKVYIGEFAVTAGKQGKGNLNAALGEAAFMVGMERNPEVVKMDSYAPTFVNVNDRKWNPDMIVFNSSQVYGTPSYYAVQLFSTNRPDRVVPAIVTMNTDTTRNDKWSHLHGGIALSAWNTVAQFKAVTVTKNRKRLLSDDFSAGVGQWKQKQDRWTIKDQMIRNQGKVTEALVATGDTAWTDYTLSLQARKVSGAEGFIVHFLMNSGNDCWWNLGGWNNSVSVVEQTEAGNRSAISQRLEKKIETGRWYAIRIEVKGHQAFCYLDNRLIHKVELRQRFQPSLYATAGVQEKAGLVIIKMVNPFNQPRICKFVLNYRQQIKYKGEVTVMTSKSILDENSFREPEKVVPMTQEVSGLKNTFHYECPPNSIVVIKLRYKKRIIGGKDCC